MLPRSVTLYGPPGKVSEFSVVPWGTRVVRFQPKVRRSKTKSQRNLKRCKGRQHTVEPCNRIRPERISPAEPGANMTNVVLLHPSHCVVKPRIFEVEPLAEPY